MISQAKTICPAMPQCTSAARLPTPAPMTPPEVTCVVESGKPAWEAARITTALDVSAEKPCGVSMS